MNFVGRSLEELVPSTLPLPFQARKYSLPIESIRTRLVEDRGGKILFNDPGIELFYPAIRLAFMSALQVGLKLIAENRVGLPEITKIALQGLVAKIGYIRSITRLLLTARVRSVVQAFK